MKVITTPLEGLLVLEPRVFGDERGFFYESYNARQFAEATGVACLLYTSPSPRDS